MKNAPPIVEIDQLPNAPHPRHTEILFGQEAAEETFLKSYNANRLHHAWLITGKKGVGKATLAWKIAQKVLTDAPESQASKPTNKLYPPSNLNEIGQISNLSHPNLTLIRRPWDAKLKKHKALIPVDEIRNLKQFFSMKATDNHWRVAIIDCMDDANRQSENALLKLLEEPPARTLLLLIAHQPSNLLPTIRSRCQTLRLPSLNYEDQGRALHQAGISIADMMGITELSDGSVGRAIELAENGGLERYHQLLKLMATMPKLDRAQAMQFAEQVTGIKNAQLLPILLHAMMLFVMRMAKSAAGATELTYIGDESAIFAKLAPNRYAAQTWAELYHAQQTKLTHAVAVNLDPAHLVLDTLTKINNTAHNISIKP